ncbi:hypothetical protein FNV43_RR02224 [Rhamnella rubrinervis]|uniref:Uncharacterized protein n=1 Tax=Rhamnella rubrinervis TaxID=2594499 RepID=A0A8K0MSS8_9ROSA|nr:hypothetical protein FNV43_RR02224 [Rhamnella rubrinervis]
MGDRVPPRWHPVIGPEEGVKAAVFALHYLIPYSDWLPLDGRVGTLAVQCLVELKTGHAQKKGLVGGGEILSVTALKADKGVGSWHRLDPPFNVIGGNVITLDDGLLVVHSKEVLFMVALEFHHHAVVEHVH